MDRNGFGAKLVHSFLSSLSARRAWIEMTFRLFLPSSQRVALRKESVDRNFHVPVGVAVIVQSLSARRAWIEIALCMGI